MTLDKFEECEDENSSSSARMIIGSVFGVYKNTSDVYSMCKELGRLPGVGIVSFVGLHWSKKMLIVVDNQPHICVCGLPMHQDLSIPSRGIKL